LLLYHFAILLHLSLTFVYMKVFSAKQIREWDEYTIRHKPVAPIDLMERAAQACSQWIDNHLPAAAPLKIFCGPGNNGGDGLAIARLQKAAGRKAAVFILLSEQYSDDFSINFERLKAAGIQYDFIDSIDNLPVIEKNSFVVDALYGYGLNRPLSGLPAALVDHINQSRATILSIDIASGLFADKSSVGNTIIRPAYTLSFQAFKLAFLLPENEPYTGKVSIMDIQLHPEWYRSTEAIYEMITDNMASSLYKPRKVFSHKGNFGNLLLIAGSYGMMGATILSAKACLRAGAGKLTCYIPACGYSILQSAVPEAMCITDSGEKHFEHPDFPGHFDALAAGPGIGQYNNNRLMLEYIFNYHPGPLILDADALNLLAIHQHLYHKIPPGTILTPHPKEFERLFGSSGNHFDRLELAIQKAQELGVFIILKGKYTFIAAPSGKGFFNTTGNPGMATAGSGDVLTGILLGLSGQYQPEQAAILGTYLHGLSGDIAAKEKSQEAMIAGDIISSLPEAFKTVAQMRKGL